ncbi:6314_t:CDS:2 [Funneliformis caledonium]|uniref:6314_t:CDS:1 n=1 Tax=Funneliformis caledonium TaxID=1117310 RepID=A0A9N8VA65_9GLOM|nr:6314_t:CDS:2 [Funneliformis caledonium]
MQSTSFRLSKELLNQARNRLLEFQEEKMEANEDMKPIIIKENVLAKPTSIIAELSESFLLAFVWSMGKIIAYEVPLTSHGAVAGRIALLIYHIQLWLLKLATARQPLVYMIFRQATFLTNTTHQIYLAIKLFFHASEWYEGNARIALPTRISYEYQFDNITNVGFSTTECNAPGIPNYQLHIPAVELFNGASVGIPDAAVYGFYLDLWNYKI